MGFSAEEGTPSAAELRQTSDANLTGQDLLDGNTGDEGAADDQGGDDGGSDESLEARLARGQEQDPRQPRQQQEDKTPRDLTRAVNMYREDNKRIAAENAQLREYQARAEAERAAMNQRFQEIQARRAQDEAARIAAANPPDPEPDPIADPEGHDLWEKRQAAAAHAELQRQVVATQQAVVKQQQERVVSELFQGLGQFELAFQASTAPDYQQAFDHLVGALFGHFQMLGYADGVQADGSYIEAQDEIRGETGALARERERFIRSCLELKTDGTLFPDGKPYRWKKDPALEIYKAAHNVGYRTPGRPPSAAPAGRTVNGRPASNRAEALERARRGSAGAGGRGGETRGEITEADLAGMNEGEMAYLLRNNKGALDRAMGKGR